MSHWLAQLAIPADAWPPLGLSALVPLLLVAVIVPLSRRRGRGVATALTLRTIVLLATGFGVLAAIGTLAVIHTGFRELRQRHVADVRVLADLLEHNPLGMGAGDTQLRLTLFRAKNPGVAFVAAGTDGCQGLCLMSFPERGIDARALREGLVAAWATNPSDAGTVSIGTRSYLLVGSPVRDPSGKPGSAVIAGIDAQYLADQAARTAWLLLIVSYTLLVAVGAATWKQVSRSLATRIHAMNQQLRSGVADESTHESLEVDGHELRELADSVSAYIKRTLEEKSSSEERHRRLAELSPDAVIMCADRRIRLVNPAAIALTGAKNRTELVASPIDRFLQFADEKPPEKTSALRPATWQRLDGRTLHVEVAEITDSSGEEVIRQFVVRDVTSRRQREADLAHRAEHDSLTGLVNRARFEARLRELFDPSANTASKFGESREVAVVFIDLDGFKPVNDTYGHAAGDAVLVAVAGRLRDSTRGSDLIARLGGDEFAVLLEVRERSELNAVAQRILKALQQPIPHNGIPMTIGASLGIASTRPPGADEPADGKRVMTAADLVKAADEAMYAAKTTGGDRFVIVGPPEQSPGGRADIRFPALA